MRRHHNDVSRRALDFEVLGRRGHGRLKVAWRRRAVKQMVEIGPKKENGI